MGPQAALRPHRPGRHPRRGLHGRHPDPHRHHGQDLRRHLRGRQPGRRRRRAAGVGGGRAPSKARSGNGSTPPPSSGSAASTASTPPPARSRARPSSSARRQGPGGHRLRWRDRSQLGRGRAPQPVHHRHRQRASRPDRGGHRPDHLRQATTTRSATRSPCWARASPVSSPSSARPSSATWAASPASPWSASPTPPPRSCSPSPAPTTPCSSRPTGRSRPTRCRIADIAGHLGTAGISEQPAHRDRAGSRC